MSYQLKHFHLEVIKNLPPCLAALEDHYLVSIFNVAHH